MNIRVYDSPKFCDRFTVIVDNDCYGMSSNPLSPVGFNQWSGELGTDVIEGDHLGEKLDTIPDCIREAINERLVLHYESHLYILCEMQ